MTTGAIAFAEEYWRWLRREIVDEPAPGPFALAPELAEVIARQCHIEFERGVKEQTDKARLKLLEAR